MSSSSSLLSAIKYWIRRSEVCDIPEDLSASFARCDADVYSNMPVVLKIGCTLLPVCSCEAEMFFSG